MSWKLLDEFPPGLVRCLAKRKLTGKRVVALSDEEIAIASGIPLKQVKWIYCQPSWSEVKVQDLRKFCDACCFDPECSADRNRVRAYLKSASGAKFSYLRNSPWWKTVFLPLITEIFKHGR